jgi:hypothetical protein
MQNCNILRSYTSHTQAAGSAGAPRTAHTQHTQHTSASTAHSLAAATLPTTAHSLLADGGLPKASKHESHRTRMFVRAAPSCAELLTRDRVQGSWSEGSEKAPQVSQAEQDYAAKLDRERTLRHTLQALQESKAAEAKSTAAKLQKKVTGLGLSARTGSSNYTP